MDQYLSSNSKIIINCDMGEGLPNDAAIMPYIQWCSVACGYHAGDRKTMQATIRLAKQYNVKVGAHPSYPDRAGFGRNDMQLPQAELIQIVADQLVLFQEICNEESYSVSFIKPHGALYNAAARDTAIAKAIIQGMKLSNGWVPILAPYNSQLALFAEQQGIYVFFEAFADRNYTKDGALVNRNHPQSIIHDADQVLQHVKQIHEKGTVKTIDGTQWPIKADTFCVHGDHPNTLLIVKALAQQYNSEV